MLVWIPIGVEPWGGDGKRIWTLSRRPDPISDNKNDNTNDDNDDTYHTLL